MLPLLTPLNTCNIASIGVAVGGEVGSCEERPRHNQERLSKGKGKLNQADEEGFVKQFNIEEREPPDKINTKK